MKFNWELMKLIKIKKWDSINTEKVQNINKKWKIKLYLIEFYQILLKIPIIIKMNNLKKIIQSKIFIHKNIRKLINRKI